MKSENYLGNRIVSVSKNESRRQIWNCWDQKPATATTRKEDGFVATISMRVTSRRTRRDKIRILPGTRVQE